ncbi:MAG: ParB N-terminal domain-containing protein [Calditrichaeota bacterium]|nr:ParB N-terminal domain-containing protein [Calditrichota bacterium]
MKVKIDDVIITDRIRQELHDLSELKSSIRQVGLLNPIIINEEYELLSGFRRLNACRQLDWKEIDAIMVHTGDDELKKIEVEYHENIGRKDLTEVDIQAYERKRQTLLNPPKRFRFFNIFKFIVEFFRHLFHGRKNLKTKN